MIRFVGEDPAFASGSSMPLDEIPERPYSLAGTTVRAVVDSPAVASAVLRALARGADAVVELRMADTSEFVDAAQRLADVSPPTPTLLARDQQELLALLAAGHTLSEAAGRLGMSSRTAHRRLGAARAVLGATTNAEAVASLRATRVVSRCSPSRA